MRSDDGRLPNKAVITIFHREDKDNLAQDLVATSSLETDRSYCSISNQYQLCYSDQTLRLVACRNQQNHVVAEASDLLRIH